MRQVPASIYILSADVGLSYKSTASAATNRDISVSTVRKTKEFNS